MTLSQLSDFKRWHVGHRQDHAIEFALCDLVLGAWVAGWTSLPAFIVIDHAGWLPASMAMVLTPEFYIGLRRRLHLRQVLRCDWLEAVREPRRPS
ncbi:MAG: hypothetical protein RL722_2882 [Pseudomonadota bacterium]|jgi:hypothetical protein